MKKILVLGVNGFIGHHLTRRIIESTDWEVHGMDMNTDRVREWTDHPRFHFFEGDITINKEWIEYHVKKCDVVLPLVDAARFAPAGGTLEAGGRIESQLTRRLRDALHAGLRHLQMGQVLLASIGSTAPFVGLLGTVWGIYHALLSISAAGSITIERVAGPVGEALVMTAAGLAVAIPAVLAYNVFGKLVAACEAELEGFAHDLREIVAERS